MSNTRRGNDRSNAESQVASFFSKLSNHRRQNEKNTQRPTTNSRDYRCRSLRGGSARHRLSPTRSPATAFSRADSRWNDVQQWTVLIDWRLLAAGIWSGPAPQTPKDVLCSEQPG